MPWNDDSKPGPWGSPPKSEEPYRPTGSGDRDAPKDDQPTDKPNDKPLGERPKDGPKADRPSAPGPWSGETPRPRLPRRPQTGEQGRRLTPAGQSPERGPGSSGPQHGPTLEELIRHFRERLARAASGAGDRRRRRQTALALIGVIVAAWAASGLYVVQPEQEAVITRFGRFVGETGPGLNYHLPAPIEAVEKVSVTSVRSLDIGAAGGAGSPDASTPDNATSDSATPVSDPQDVPSGDLMLTGDENIVDLNFTVQWRVNDPAKYLFDLFDPDGVVKMVAQSAMREVVGKTPLQDIMTTGRGQLQTQAQALMQRVLDGYGAGVSIVEVQIRGANPPREVIPAFREVINAGQDAETAVNQADAYRNRVVNEAKGDAAKIVQDAEGYAQQAVLEAQGDASQFTQVDGEYRQAPAVTRQRLYLETMQRVLSASNKVIVDTPKGSTAPIVLPPDIFKHGGDAQGAAPTQAPQPQAAPPVAQAAPAPNAGAAQ